MACQRRRRLRLRLGDMPMPMPRPTETRWLKQRLAIHLALKCLCGVRERGDYGGIRVMVMNTVVNRDRGNTGWQAVEPPRRVPGQRLRKTHLPFPHHIVLCECRGRRLFPQAKSLRLCAGACWFAAWFAACLGHAHRYSIALFTPCAASTPSSPLACTTVSRVVWDSVALPAQRQQLLVSRSA